LRDHGEFDVFGLLIRRNRSKASWALILESREMSGLDISKRDAKVCVRVAGAGRRKTVETVTTWDSMTSQILALRDHLVAERITCCGDGSH
jgi:hypothetical protein